MNLTAYQPPKAERRTDAPFTFPNQRPLPVADRPRVASLRCAGTYFTAGRVDPFRTCGTTTSLTGRESCPATAAIGRVEPRVRPSGKPVGKAPGTAQAKISEAEPGGPDKARRGLAMEGSAMHQPGESPGTFSSWLGMRRGVTRQGVASRLQAGSPSVVLQPTVKRESDGECHSRAIFSKARHAPNRTAQSSASRFVPKSRLVAGPGPIPRAGLIAAICVSWTIAGVAGVFLIGVILI